MYHTLHSPPLLVQIVSGQQTNGQCTPVQSHTITINHTPSPHQQSPCPTTFLFDGNAQNGHHLIQAEGHYPPEVYQMMGVEMPHIRHHGFGTPVPLNSTLNGNWQKRNYNMNYNAPTMPPPHLNFRHHGYPNGVIKKPNWGNKQRRYYNRETTGMFGYREQQNTSQQYDLLPTPPLLQPQPLALSSSSSSSSSQAETYHSDSGISGTSSRPPTPKNSTDFCPTESSDDRDSVSSSSSPSPSSSSSSSSSKKHEKEKTQEYHEIPRLSLILTQHRLNPYNTNSLQYSHQQKDFNAHEGSMPLVRPTQLQHNNQNKKRSGNSKTPPKNLRGKKSSNEMLIAPFKNYSNSYIAPDRFLSRSHLVQIKKSPSDLLKNCKWDNLSREIWDKFMACQQSEQTYRNKISLWKYLYIFIKSNFPRYGLFIAGSTINGFGSDSSDVDLCLLVRNTEIIQRYEAINHLGEIGDSISTCNFIDQCDLIEAKVPILRFHDSVCNLVVDLNCNNAVGIRNTHMLYCYSQIDWRVRPLVLVIKLWAHANGINDAKNMTISSYSLTLMVIHFLQSGVQPAVLPCLHDMYPTKFNSFTDVHGMDMHENLVIPMRPVDQSNRQTLGELFYEFFRYYVNFDFNNFAVSVRKPHKLLINECRFASSWKNDPYQWKYLCIEEPFDLTNTARAVYDYEAFIMIKTVFHRTFQRLKENQQLASIFPAQVNVDSKGP